MSSEIISILENKFNIQILLSFKDGKMQYCPLQKILKINSATLATRLEQLELAGLISKSSCKIDTRCYWYELTKKGNRITKILSQITD